MIKRFITWLHNRYVVLPDLREQFGPDVEVTQGVEVVYFPDQIMHAQMQSKFHTKH